MKIQYFKKKSYSGSRSNEVRNKSPKSLCSKILGVPYVERKRYISSRSKCMIYGPRDPP
jgi:hypothetical protein